MGAPVMCEPSFTDSELDEHIRSALKAAIEGDFDYYNQLVAVMYRKGRLVTEEVALLVTCLKAVTGAVRYIDITHHRSLLVAISGMSLWDYDTDVMDALVELLAHLASSRGEYVDLCLEMLVINFMPPTSPSSASYFVDLLKQSRGLTKKNQVLDRVHSTLLNIARMSPVHSPRKLEKIVIDRMPNIKMKEHVFIETYVENMLRLLTGRISEFVGSSMLLFAVVDCLRDLDVEIDWSDILRDDFHKGKSDLELETFEVPIDHIQQDYNEFDWESLIQRFSGVDVARKLDNLMVLVFEHLKTSSESDHLVQVFETLLQSFRITILTAYKSKFCQFVMFYACSLDPESCGKKFVSMLVNTFVSGLNPELRMSAVSYLASYLARAKFVDISLIATILESVVNWCYVYCKEQVGDINPKAHKVFYAGCQATMYILCFRMRQMLAIPRLKLQLLHMHIDDILGHPLKPLQVCLPSIVEEFLRLAKDNHIFSLPQIFADHGLLESEHSRAFGGMDRLDVFFPFDPCLLLKCDRYIRPNYVSWSMVRSTYDEEGTSDEDEEEDTEACADYDRVGIPIAGRARSSDEDAFELDEFDVSLDKMSITPGDTSRKFGGSVQRFMQMPSKIRPSTSPESL
ncbi:RNA polymerase I-specific transcription initiation factor rrn3-like isoform X1 [Primulina tabacum]|uniref:RNA polymerase I-specific transcription initiation factor rrn3-like isoform X1 n=1 Tax=Primulina tabacum TaxID=48773 RepID=UPI003F5913C9